jgi:hypothetical protein
MAWPNFDTYARMLEIMSRSELSQAQLPNELLSEIRGRAKTVNDSTIRYTVEGGAVSANTSNWVCESKSRRNSSSDK